MVSAGRKRAVDKNRPGKPARTEISRIRKVKQLFEQWLQDSSGYDEETWTELKRALNENHSKTHKLFNE